MKIPYPDEDGRRKDAVIIIVLLLCYIETVALCLVLGGAR